MSHTSHSLPFSAVSAQSENPSADEGSDKKRKTIENSDYLNNALDVYAAFQNPPSLIRYESHLNTYYASVQRGNIARLTKHVSPQHRASIAHLFVQSYVIGADPDVDLTAEKKDEFVKLKTDICQSIACHKDIAVPSSYLNETEWHNRTRINAKIAVEHHLNWMIKLAQDDGAAFAKHKRKEEEVRAAYNLTP
jgi:hypothetical protein